MWIIIHRSKYEKIKYRVVRAIWSSKYYLKKWMKDNSLNIIVSIFMIIGLIAFIPSFWWNDVKDIDWIVDFINFHEEYRTEGGLRFDRKYLLTKGIRR